MSEMIDNEIIKALECCSNDGMLNCRNCPYEKSCNTGKSDMQKDALGLINRQKAEIERLRDIIRVTDETIKKACALAKSEAIKEFAGRLKKKTYPFPCAIGVENAVTIRAINDLVKEMTEASDERS